MAKPQIVKLMVDGELVDFLVQIDGNGEWACYSKGEDGGRTFYFSPKGVDDKGKEIEISLAEHVKRHNAANGEKPVLADDAVVDEQAEELAAWLGGDGVAADDGDGDESSEDDGD